MRNSDSDENMFKDIYQLKRKVNKSSLPMNVDAFWSNLDKTGILKDEMGWQLEKQQQKFLVDESSPCCRSTTLVHGTVNRISESY